MRRQQVAFEPSAPSYLLVKELDGDVFMHGGTKLE